MASLEFTCTAITPIEPTVTIGDATIFSPTQPNQFEAYNNGQEQASDTGLQGYIHTTTTDTVGFTDRAVEQSLNGTRDLAQEFEGITSGEKTTTVAEYLGRYRHVYSGHFSTEKHISVSDFFNQDQMKQKLFGSLGVSGTMKFKIVWNADPTIYGFYIMSYTPPGVTSSPHPYTYMNHRYRDWETDRKSTRLNSSHSAKSRMPSSA